MFQIINQQWRELNIIMAEVIIQDERLTADPKVEKLKLARNSKGYTWEIQMIKDPKVTWEQAQERLKELNNNMLKDYGAEQFQLLSFI